MCQIADVYFRRQVLVQLLILFDHLLHYRVDAAGKGAVEGQSVLDPSDVREWHADVAHHRRSAGSASITSRRVSSCAPPALSARPSPTLSISSSTARPIGCVRDIRPRLTPQVRWKIQKAECKVFQKPALADADFARARELRAAALRPFRPYEHRVGNSQLSRLWDKSIMLDDERLLAHNAECVGSTV